MTADRWQRIKELFRKGLELEPEERADFLNKACENDQALRDEVLALLDTQDGKDGFLEPPSESDLAGQEQGDRLVGKKLGPYHLVRLISSGGMGSVFEARQEHPKRIVAVKVMREGIASQSALRRFEYEAEILAHLSHPNIAAVIEAGTQGGNGEGGVPYFVMEYIPQALAVTEYVKTRQLSITDRLRLFLQVCGAVHHGHQRGIIHRDLKPSNILVDAEGKVKVIDFGVARATDSDIAITTMQTDVGQLLGTVQYMSPEQCRADPRDLDIRSDVYALGVVLYELLSGELPYDVRHIAVFEATRLICEKEPKRPSTKHKNLRGDIETILLKALEKERSRRYQSVADFASDIDRHLKGLEIQARPTGPATRTWKRIKRNPVVSGAVGIAALAILGAMVYVLFWAYPQVIEERNKALAAKNEVEEEAKRTRKVNSFLEGMLSLPEPGQEGRDVKVVEALEEAVKRMEREFGGMPEIKASLQDSIGCTYLGLGQVAEGEKLIAAAVETATRILGEEHPTTLLYRGHLGTAYRALGRLAEAETLLRDVLAVYRRTLGDEAGPTYDAMMNLAWVLNTKHDFNEAEALLRRVVDHHRQHLGMEQAVTLHAMNLLAGSLRELGRPVEAKELLLDVLAVSPRVFGEEHVETLEALNMLATILNHLGDYDEAIETHRKVLDIKRRVLGDEHPDTLVTMNNLAVALKRKGMYEESEAIFRNLVEIHRRCQGEEHPMTVGAIDNLASVLGQQGKIAEAKKLILKVVEIRKRTLGDEHILTLRSLNTLGLSLYTEGDHVEAEALLRKVMEARERILGRDHPDTMLTCGYLAAVLSAQGKNEEASVLYREVLDFRTERFGPDHPLTLTAMRGMAVVLFALDRVEEAEQIQRAILESRVRQWGEEHPDTLLAFHDLAYALMSQDRFDEAAPLFEKALRLSTGKLPDTHQLIRFLHLNHGRTLTGLGRFEEAEEHLLKAFDLFEAAGTSGSGHIDSVLEGLIDLYEAWGRPEEAVKWRDRLESLESATSDEPNA